MNNRTRYVWIKTKNVGDFNFEHFNFGQKLSGLSPIVMIVCDRWGYIFPIKNTFTDERLIFGTYWTSRPELYKDIYPNELELKVELSGSHASFLNLDITIKEGLFVYKLFDKRDAFPFLSFVCLTSPATFRFLFLPKTRELIHRLNNQGAK